MEEGQAKLAVQSLAPLAAAAAAASTGLKIFLNESEDGAKALAAVKSGLDDAKRGNGRVSVHLHLHSQHQEVVIELLNGFAISTQVRDAIGRIPAVSRVREL